MRKLALAAAIAMASIVPQSASHAAAHIDKLLSKVVADTRECVIFKLQGVSVADPAVAGGEWFSLKKDHPSFNEMFALLLTAKAAERLTEVYTDSTSACGHASVTVIALV